MKYEQFQEVFMVREGVFYQGTILQEVEGDLYTVKLICGAEKDFFEWEIYDTHEKALKAYNDEFM